MKKQPFPLTLFLLIYLSISVNATAQTVEISDPNLRAAIETALNKPSGNPITAAEMETLTFLDAGARQVRVLTGLESATNLTFLFLLDNSISDLTPLGGLTNLRFLGLQNNSVSDLSPVVGLTNLTFLGLQNNSVSDLSPLVENTGLGAEHTVNVMGNPLSYPSFHTHIPALQAREVEVLFDPRTPTTPRIISGDAQNGRTGTALAQPFVVEVWDENGLAFEGVPVMFTATEGGGSLHPEITMTDADGRAESLLMLGSAPGTNTVEAGVEGISQIFSAEAFLPVPTTLEGISGDNQIGMTSEALANSFVVEVRDQYDDPMAGVAVTFAISAGDGALSDTSVDTDANGLAQSTLTPGRERGTNTVKVSVESIAKTVTFNAFAETLLFDLSLPSGVSLIHVPLKVMSVDGMEGAIESVGDLYDALGGAATVNMLTTLDPNTQGWQSYLGDASRNTNADKTVNDKLGIVANMSVPVSVRLGGDALGVDGSSTFTLNQGANLVGLPLNDSRITRVSDLFALEGIADNVSTITVSDNGLLKAVRQAGDDGDIAVTGGGAFFLTASETAMVTLSGDGWKHTATTAAPSLVLEGSQVSGATPVLALSGSIVDERTGLHTNDFRVIVKNLSTGSVVTTVIGDAGSTSSQGSYRLTVVDIKGGRAAAIGDTFEISLRSPDASIGVQPLRYTVTAEDVRRSRIQLPALILQEIPAETELLRNYPNPFNPETWIPYRLAQDAFVVLTIYDGNGRVVRTLEVGHQTAAVYESRSKAVYWDGRNEVGERVASGLYFYTLAAGDFSATRKTVILK